MSVDILNACQHAADLSSPTEDSEVRSEQRQRRNEP